MNLKKTILSILVVPFLTGCVSLKEVGESGNTLNENIAVDKVNWPKQYEPEKAAFFVHNEIDIEASPEVVWNILVDAEQWPNWYKGALNVDVLDSNDGKLTPGSTFSWNTMGLDFNSVIKEFKPPYRLSWESKRRAIQGYHTWLIIPTDQGVKIITDESQHGFLAYLQPIFVPNKLRKLHDVWLEELKLKAEKMEVTSENL